VTAAATEPTLLELASAVRRSRGHEEPATLAVVEGAMTLGASAPLHVHAEDEALTVLEGSMTVYAGAQTVQLGPGDSFVAPADVPHTYRSDATRVRYLAASFVRSARAYEDFLRAVTRPPFQPAERVAGGWAGTQEAAALAHVAAANGIQILGAPGELPDDLQHSFAA
jgi:quercetin dioxygenase-like cupin family protein